MSIMGREMTTDVEWLRVLGWCVVGTGYVWALCHLSAIGATAVRSWRRRRLVRVRLKPEAERVDQEARAEREWLRLRLRVIAAQQREGEES
jgi:hypothetical protein